MKPTRYFLPVLSAAALSVFSNSAEGALVFTVTPTGPDLVITGQFGLDIGTATPVIQNKAHENETGAFFGAITSGAEGDLMDVYNVTITPGTGYGLGGANLAATTTFTTSGNGIYFSANFGQIGLPDGYFSNTVLSGSVTYENASLVDLGATPGTYTYDIEIPQLGGGVNTDTVTINVVPEPSSFALVGLSGLAFLCKRRRN